ncbi:hypothetical protein [Sulfurospirillum cavolei]|uniref:hypothetical protein n=1 Tax=Sulfurospirillum cavolei TaxID=366522 RepID=UPI003FA1F5AB
MLDRQSIIDAADISTGKINVPEWGGEVYVKSPSIRERDILGGYTRKYLEVVKDKKGEPVLDESGNTKVKFIQSEEAEKAFSAFRLYKVGFSLCDENGKRLFGDEEIETVLAQKSPESIDRLFGEIEKALEKKD